MAKPPKPPKVTRRQFSLTLSVLVLIAGGLYAYYRAPYVCCAPPPSDPRTVALQEFRNGCMKTARHANGGGDLVMDDATEAKIGAYCGCVADAIDANVPPADIVKLGEDQESDATRKLLGNIIQGCQPKLAQ